MCGGGEEGEEWGGVREESMQCVFRYIGRYLDGAFSVGHVIGRCTIKDSLFSTNTS